jgi:hypothetical protein
VLRWLYYALHCNKFQLAPYKRSTIFDLPSKTAPIQVASLLAFGPFADYYLNWRNLLEYKFSSGAIIFILLSCLLAVFQHWTILNSFISDFGSHENGLCSYIGLATF